MHRVVIHGYQPGLNKTAFEQLLCGRADMLLRNAKTSVDQVVGGKEVVITCRDQESARALADALDAIGARCRVEVAGTSY